MELYAELCARIAGEEKNEKDQSIYSGSGIDYPGLAVAMGAI